MRILEYTGLDTSAVASSYAKVTKAIAAGDFRAAQVKKLANVAHGKFYRARLDDANRLLFALVRAPGGVCALMLEVIAHHAYEQSRFLRGATVDEALIPDLLPEEAEREAEPLRYLHAQRNTIHLLDKPISFDDTQQAVFDTPAPLIVVGSAGSGKTALTLEKMKQAQGEVLYVTQSAYLAQHARGLYHAHAHDTAHQDAVFMSYRELLESVRMPAGREATWRDFVGWFQRMRQGQAFKGLDAHQSFEEIRGVLAAPAQGVLTRAQYLALGVRQCLFAPAQRDTLYDLFDKYRQWLADSGLYDLNLVAQAWMEAAQPQYDFVVIDEVQDLTPVQLRLVLKMLKHPGHFLLCGDANQIVHPNFFSWAQVKTLFWQDAALAERQALRVLWSNFRNGQNVTRLANQLLKIKQQRFGSIDRESNHLVQAVGTEAGEVHLLPDKPASTTELDKQTRQSTRFAVLVLREEDKPAARACFGTPLLFSVHEAKGLEYDNIILYRVVSEHRSAFADITEGVRPEDLLADELDYRRARDKSDKSLDTYKFYVNALYVALTRAVRNLYLVESDTGHPLFGLLGLAEAGAAVKVQAAQSSREDWQKEARRLALQGKQEQAEAIERGILKQTPVPWPVWDEPRTRELLGKVFKERIPGQKHRQTLLDMAVIHHLPTLAGALAELPGFGNHQSISAQANGITRKHFAAYGQKQFKDILRQCEQHGLEHRLPMNLTPLMAATLMRNLPLVEALIERGADVQAVDHFGTTALHWLLRLAAQTPPEAGYTRPPFAALYDLLAPPTLDLSTGQRLVRIERHQSEYLLVQTMWALQLPAFAQPNPNRFGGMNTALLLDAWQHLPTHVLSPQRNRRTHLSGVLSRNEVDRDYAYNRRLFIRLRQGLYQFNPLLQVRRTLNGQETWVPIWQAQNLPFIWHFSGVLNRFGLEHMLQAAGQPIPAESALYF